VLTVHDGLLLGSNHLHTYFGTSAFICTTAFSETGVPALFTTFPSTNTLPTPQMYQKQMKTTIANFSCQMRFFPQWLRMEESTLQAIHQKKQKNVASQIEKFLPEW
jgi:hypothetical protein